GFIGCGLIGRSHATKLQEPVGEGLAKIVSAFDPDVDRAQAFGEQFAATRADSAERVIDESDAVYVATWTAAHPELVEMVAAAGKPVFCEKPLGVDLATSQKMVDTVEAAGVINQVGLVLRNSPSFRWLYHQVRSGEHGAPMSMVFRDDQYIPTQGAYGSTWRGDVGKAGAGTLLEHSIHDLDLIEWILGPIERVTCLTANSHGIEGIEDQATVTLQAASGAICTLSSTWHDVMTRPSQRLVEVLCRDGYLALDGDWHGPLRRDVNDGQSTIEAGESTIGVAAELDGLGTNPDAAFVNAVLEGRPAYPDFRIALRAHELCDAAYRSADRNGEPVDV
ncbi:MAG: Gfo/Idh/MocA family oxidoreductase, partial [Acidimicrobiales bacterium]|nr:Gfo/Idh/MocA family oxidoreductase [Acidimicrobiales bacterium]